LIESGWLLGFESVILRRDIMCLAIPSKIVKIEDNIGIIDVEGVQKEVSLLLIEDPRIGDYVIVHAGFAIQKIDEAEANESLKILREMASLGYESDETT
jgi:hydrogenase expression/formation protein HypC